jgi:hypothetical protein
VEIKVDDNPVHQNIPGLQSALQLADKDLYPNIHTIFKFWHMMIDLITGIYSQIY